MIRKLARPMLASVFVADGVDMLRNQKDHLEDAETLISQVRSVTPNPYLKYVPASPRVAVQAVAGTKVAAGALYGLGKAPRLAAGALVVAQLATAASRHAFWQTQDKSEKKERRAGFLTDVGLLGGLFLATADTAGKPGLAWRANHAGKQLNKKVQNALPTQSETEKKVSAFTDSAKEKAGVLQEKAQDAYSRTAEYVDDNKDSWADQIRDFAEQATEKASELLEDGKKAAEPQLKELRKQSKKQAKNLRKQSKKLKKQLG